MNRSEVLVKVIEICKEVFDKDDLILTETSSSKDVAEWDSLIQLSIISDLEDEFSVQFTLDEIKDSKTIGEFVDAVIRHL